MIMPMQPQWQNDVMDIWLQASIQSHGFIPAQQWQQAYPLVRDTYLPRSQVTVWQDGQQVLGFLGLVQNSYVGALFVHPQHQGRGIGCELLTHCQAHHSHLFLTVFAENPGAIRFYRRHGFEILRKQESDFPGHEEYIMEWQK